MEYKEIIEELKSKENIEIQAIIFELLLSNKINFNQLSELYVEHLKKKDKDKQNIIFGLSIPLCQYWENSNIKPPKQKEFIRCKSAYNLLKSKMFKGAEIEKDWKKIVKKHKYTEDENGIHNYKD